MTVAEKETCWPISMDVLGITEGVDGIGPISTE